MRLRRRRQAVDTGIYEDPVDGQYRFFGQAEKYAVGCLILYWREGTERSFVKAVTQLGSSRRVGDKFFGMAIQVGAEPITLTQLGMSAGDLDQFMDGFNRGELILPDRSTGSRSNRCRFGGTGYEPGSSGRSWVQVCEIG